MSKILALNKKDKLYYEQISDGFISTKKVYVKNKKIIHYWFKV